MSQTLFTAAERRDFLTRGFSRRDLGRLAGMLAAGASLPFFNESSMAQGTFRDAGHPSRCNDALVE